MNQIDLIEKKFLYTARFQKMYAKMIDALCYEMILQLL